MRLFLTGAAVRLENLLEERSCSYRNEALV
jgi:hypothetical protein